MIVKVFLLRVLDDHRLPIIAGFLLTLLFTLSITGRNVVQEILHLFMLLGAFTLILRYKELYYSLNKNVLLIIVVFSLYFFSAFISSAVNGWDEYDLEKLLDYSYFLGALLLWPLYKRVSLSASYFWWGVIFCALLAGYYAIDDVLAHGVGYRVTGPMGRTILFGEIALLAAVLSVASIPFFLKQYPKLLIIVPILAALSGICASYFTFSRGVVTFVPLFLIFAVWYFAKVELCSKKKLITVVCGLCLLPAIGLTSVSDKLLTRLHASIGETNAFFLGESVASNSFGARLEMWKAAKLGFEESPLLGVGTGKFPQLILDLDEQDKVDPSIALNQASGKPHSHAHNELMNVLATRGIVGVVITIALFYVLFSMFWQALKGGGKEKSYGFAGVSLILGYIHFSIADTVLFHPVTLNFFLVCSITLLFFIEQEKAKENNE